MIERIKQVVIASVLCLGGSIALMQPVGAIKVLESQCSGQNASTAVCQSRGDSAGSMIGSVVNLLMYALGAVSTIMIVIGGIRFATSNGNPETIKQSKNIVLYAVIGLVVAVCATALVNFVLSYL